MHPLDYRRPSAEQCGHDSMAFLERLRARRSIRAFSSDPIPEGVLERCIEAAAQAPSGAHKQPWTFALVTDPAVKTKIRLAAEQEEREFYGGRAPERWLRDLAPFGTDADKPFLEEAPALIVVFAQRQGPEGEQHYYVNESVGIATGFLIAAIHMAGLATLTHTPSPMRFLGEILERPATERAFLLLPVGFPREDCHVPDLKRKSASEFLVRV